MQSFPFIYPIINDCHQIQFQKNLINRFRENLKTIYFMPENDACISFWAKNFP